MDRQAQIGLLKRLLHYVDAATNGLSFCSDRLRGESMVGHIVLSKGERSELANVAANKL